MVKMSSNTAQAILSLPVHPPVSSDQVLTEVMSVMAWMTETKEVSFCQSKKAVQKAC